MGAIAELPPPLPTKQEGNNAGCTKAWLESWEMKSTTLYLYLSQTAPASSFHRERYLLLTESLLLRWQFSTSPRGSAAWSSLALFLLLQLLLNCAHRSIRAWKNFRKHALLAEPCQEGGPSCPAKEKLLWHPLPTPWDSSRDLCARERWKLRGEMSEKPSSHFLPGLVFVHFGCDALATLN